MSEHEARRVGGPQPDESPKERVDRELGVVAAVIAALNAGWFARFWFGLPLLRRRAR